MEIILFEGVSDQNETEIENYDGCKGDDCY